MIRFFADTFYFIALLSKDDAAHEVALLYAQSAEVEIVTTSWVLAEVGNAFAEPPRRAPFVKLLQQLKSTPRATVIPASQDLFDQGADLYSRRHDKEWSLTDCISFVVMERNGSEEALTGDRHFTQAGFKALLLA